MPQFYSGITTNVIAHYFKGYWEDTTNHRPAMQAIMKRGNMETGVAGATLTWNFRAARYSSTNYAELDSIDISRSNQYAQATVPWAFETISDAITRDEIAIASGPEALVRRDKEMLGNMTKDFVSRLNYKLLNNDGASLSGNPIYGLPSIFQNVTYSGKDGTIGAGTYGGQTLALSGLSVPGAETDAWTPKAVDGTSTTYTSGSSTWIQNCVDATMYANDKATLGTSEDEQPDLMICTRADFSSMKSKIAASQRIIMSASPENAPQGLGLPGGIVLDGLEVLFDQDMVSSKAYLLNTRKIWMEMLPKPTPGSTGPSLPNGSKGKGAEYFEVFTQDDVRTNGLLVRVNWRGQTRFDPRWHCQIKTA